MLNLSADRALIFRITHIANVPWILDNGFYCASADVSDPGFRQIGSAELIAKRARRLVPAPYGGTLSDYVPFYFTPASPMLYNIKTGRGVEPVRMRDIAVIVSSLHRLTEQSIPFVFTDRHAYLDAARFSSDIAELSRIDWEILRRRDFARSDADPGKMERYQAEALVRHHVPLTAILGLACYDDETCGTIRSETARRGLSVEIRVRPGWYF